MELYRVYTKINESGSIVETNSSAFLSDTTDWVQIDEGVGDRYHHAQGNYFPAPLCDERGILRYAYVPNGSPKWRERTPEEMDADYVPPAYKPSAEDMLNALMEGIESA